MSSAHQRQMSRPRKESAMASTTPTSDKYDEIDDFINATVTQEDPQQRQAVADADAAGLPHIQVAPNQGKLLQLLIEIMGATRVLELGTLGGYSTSWMAKGLPSNGELVSLEFSPKHAEVARANLERCGVNDRVEIRVGPALETLPKLDEEGGDPFDFVFIDANKDDIVEYVEWAAKLARPGALVVVDNAVSRLVDTEPDTDDPASRAIWKVYEVIANHPSLDATAVQTVGHKGHDGLLFALVTE
ncbi:O-methyltransferase [Natronoglycomyces albus]|uniref:O-methyltransferase n=1 Tax=Natronoglycomyces albus TaxID=2811108 RepID=A0A895XZ18_9ACTN|nr:O-methyltransferase [Natronoglycomyces albus]QSB06848.1 O-methyltransferase [Natronoglycomyces albus]